jgi:hypothetical protein
MRPLNIKPTLKETNIGPVSLLLFLFFFFHVMFTLKILENAHQLMKRFNCECAIRSNAFSIQSPSFL